LGVVTITVWKIPPLPPLLVLSPTSIRPCWCCHHNCSEDFKKRGDSAIPAHGAGEGWGFAASPPLLVLSPQVFGRFAALVGVVTTDVRKIFLLKRMVMLNLFHYCPGKFF
jgi:hypothetical protein